MTATPAARATLGWSIALFTVVALAPRAAATVTPSARAGDPAAAVTTTSRPTTTLDPGEIGPGALGDIAPEPGSGREPRLEGERGTRSQLVAFIALAGGLALVGTLAARDIRRGRARREAQAGAAADGAQDEATSTRSDPVADSSTNPPSSSARQ